MSDKKKVQGEEGVTKSAVQQISEFITVHWKALLVFYLVVNSYNTLDNNQHALAQRVNKLEVIQSDVQTMRVLLERVDERTQNIEKNLDRIDKNKKDKVIKDE